MFSWSYVLEYFPEIIVKFPVTLRLVLIPFVVSMTLGFAIALVRLKKIRVVDGLLKLYVSYVRCTPVITQMFIVYFGLPVLLQKFGMNGRQRSLFTSLTASTFQLFCLRPSVPPSWRCLPARWRRATQWA